MFSDRSAPPFWWLLVCLSLVHLLVQMPFLDRVPPVVVDEPWYANTAHNLATGQGLLTTVGGSAGDRTYLYPLVLSALFKLFGTSLWLGRFTSVLLGLLAVWGMAFLGRRLAITGWPLAMTCGLFIISNVYFVLFRRLRPEALVIALSVWALYYFVVAWQTRRPAAALACALLAGASAVAHPNGALLAILLGVLFIAKAGLHRKEVRLLSGYCAGGVIAVALFLVGWGQLGTLSLLELGEDLARSRRLSVIETSIVSAFWMNLTTFVSSYSLGLKRLYIVLFELGVLGIALARYRQDRFAALLGLTGLLWFALGLALLTPFFRWAFCIVLIFALAVTGRLLSPAPGALTPGFRRAAWIAVALYGLNTLAGDAYLLKQHAGNTSYSDLTASLRGRVPAEGPVLVPLEFWLAFHERPRDSVYTSFTGGRFQLLTGGHVRYVILSDMFSQGRSPTTGLQEYPGDYDRFYSQARAYLAGHGQQIAVLPTRGYGRVEIWQLPPRSSPGASIGQPHTAERSSLGPQRPADSANDVADVTVGEPRR